MFNKLYHRNILLLGFSQFLGFFGITSFWLLFLSQHGMSLLQIGLLESIFHITSLLSEIPSGVLADRFTYKMNLYLSRFLTLISAGIMLLGNGNFYLYALGMIMSAWAYNFDSGTSSAMLFESVKESGLEEKYLKFTSLLSGISEGTRALGMVLAAFFVHGFLDVTYQIQIVLSLFGIIVIFFMKEPTVKLESTRIQSLGNISKTVRLFFKTNPAILVWMLTSQILLTFITMFYFYYQNELGNLSSWEISLVMLLSSLINIFAVWLAGKFGEKWTAKDIFKWIILIASCVLCFAFREQSFVYSIIFLVSDGLVAFFLPIYNNDIQKQLDSSIRATMLSVSSMLGSLSMIFIFPLMGILIDQFTFSISFGLLGLFLLLSNLIVCKFLK